ncbi:hypothetical protein DYB34_003979 [Aphanomyces astaci]|uniref:Uncharacterized protein n=1 Tax=Aphanomyces astaci TaxID=112090 RepID=A0A397ACR7_APHAT|nr:hypothetical protein DYB36_001006 [Aphanomyces astaci]RHY62534.1 hypothetical protein DYB34_003979 [Aphanomyces astaci]
MLIRHALQALDDAIVEALATVPSKDAKKSFKKKQGKHAAHHDATSSNETSGALYDVLTLCEPLTNDMDAMVLESLMEQAAFTATKFDGKSIEHQWTYQRCTELGYTQSAGLPRYTIASFSRCNSRHSTCWERN